MLLKMPGGRFSSWLSDKNLPGRKFHLLEYGVVHLSSSAIPKLNMVNEGLLLRNILTYRWLNSVLLLKTPGGRFFSWFLCKYLSGINFNLVEYGAEHSSSSAAIHYLVVGQDRSLFTGSIYMFPFFLEKIND